MLSLDDYELKRLSKQANQRLVRLEKWQSEHGAGFTPAYEQARFYIGERKDHLLRFQEDPTRLSPEEKQEQMFKVTAFLNNPLSTRKELNKREKLKKQIEAAGSEIEPKGLFEKTQLEKPDSDAQERHFWQLFDTAKQIGLVKSFDYRTIARVLSWKLAEDSPGVFRKVAEWMLNLDNLEKLNRQKLLQDIGRL